MVTFSISICFWFHLNKPSKDFSITGNSESVNFAFAWIASGLKFARLPDKSILLLNNPPITGKFSACPNNCWAFLTAATAGFACSCFSKAAENCSKGIWSPTTAACHCLPTNSPVIFTAPPSAKISFPSASAAIASGLKLSKFPANLAFPKIFPFTVSK